MNLNYNPKNPIHRKLKPILNSIILLFLIFVFSICSLASATLLGSWIFHNFLKLDLSVISDKDALYYTLISLVPVTVALLPVIKYIDT
jgi:hypothetical protein